MNARMGVSSRWGGFQIFKQELGYGFRNEQAWTVSDAGGRSWPKMVRAATAFLFAHDLFGKPLHTFPDHAPTHKKTPLRITKRRLL
jgi:hypothetical protein